MAGLGCLDPLLCILAVSREYQTQINRLYTQAKSTRLGLSTDSTYVCLFSSRAYFVHVTSIPYVARRILELFRTPDRRSILVLRRSGAVDRDADSIYTNLSLSTLDSMCSPIDALNLACYLDIRGTDQLYRTPENQWKKVSA